MFNSNIHAEPHWRPFISHPVFLRSMDWIRANAHSVADGIHEMGEPGWYVNVHGYETLTRASCKWENHSMTIDIQYLIEGSEAIDVTAVERLGEPTSHDESIDTFLFDDPGLPHTTLVTGPGDFTLFLPGEAHRPKIAVKQPAVLRKLVVKIPYRLIQ